MNLIVQDINVFGNIQPETVANYLESQGWQQQRKIENEAIIFINSAIKSSNYTLVLPLNLEAPDFPLTMNLLVENLAKIEEKSQLEIIEKLMTDLPNVVIKGLIVMIQSPEGDQLSGEVHLMGVVINKLEKIKMELFDRDYILAIRAYQERLPVFCGGDLVKENNCFVLKNICSFRVDE